MPEQSLTDLLPTTPDLRAERLAELKRLFPDLFTNEGRLDPDELKRLVAPNEVHETERYEFKWYGKAASKREAFAPTTATLVYDPARSVNPAKANGNMIIEGENLETLKLLLSAYREQVKVICIDPPYNTGKDFIYKDNYSKDRKSYWEETEETTDGVKLSSNAETSGRFHSDWLSMMHARLLVARQLLMSSGVLFVCCDDNEIENLKRLLDESFGSENFMALMVWKSRAFPDSRAKTGISTDHEYVLVYRKTEDGIFSGIPRDESKFSNPDNDARGTWMSRSMLGLATKEQRPNLHYAITDPTTGSSFEPPPDTGWRYGEERMIAMIAEGRVIFPPSPTGRPREKKFRADIESDRVAFPTIIDDIHTSDGTKEIREIFGETVFDFAKPSAFMIKLITQVAGEGDIVLDFFAGSGSTADGVCKLAAGGKAKCRFISVRYQSLPIQAVPQAALAIRPSQPSPSSASNA
jgi:adenine-specific DNA-methyltransferase